MRNTRVLKPLVLIASLLMASNSFSQTSVFKLKVKETYYKTDPKAPWQKIETPKGDLIVLDFSENKISQYGSIKDEFSVTHMTKDEKSGKVRTFFTTVNNKNKEVIIEFDMSMDDPNGNDMYFMYNNGSLIFWYHVEIQ